MKKHIFKVVITMLIFSIIPAMLVYFSKVYFQPLIDKNIDTFFKTRLELLANKVIYDNDIVASEKILKVKLHGVLQKIKLYFARKNGKNIAYLIEHTYPNGYSGDILILTAVSIDKKIIGLRVINHAETAGLGDKIDTNKSSWIMQFDDVYYNSDHWHLKQNSQFDAITGATITSKAILNSTNELMQYLQQNNLLN